MRTVQRRAPEGAVPTARLVLDYDDRRKVRQRVHLTDGQELALLLPRGTLLRGGDHLLADDGLVIAVEAAPERLSSATTGDPLLLARAAYHLGNRHVPLQVDNGRLRYRHDHVLDQMVVNLGLILTEVEAPFDPETGAYQAHGQAGHDHAGHDHAGHDHAGHDHDRPPHEHGHD